jgi:uncharacterized protein
MTLNYAKNHSEIKKMVNQNDRIPIIVESVISLIKPVKMFLINSISTIYYHSYNSHAKGFEIVAHYNLMVICSQDNGLHEIQETIENHCKPITPVTALVLSQTLFGRNLLTNPVFSNSILVQGKIIYESAGNACEQMEETFELKDIPNECRNAFRRASGFLASAELHLLRNELSLAAFMLHQSIEQYCYGSILEQMGINPKTHNLDKLYRLMRFYTFEMAEVFPRDTETEEKLFVTIKEAYIKSRYSATCNIKSSDLKIIRDRLRILFKV